MKSDKSIDYGTPYISCAFGAFFFFTVFIVGLEPCVIIFTKENLEKLQKYHSEELKKALENSLENIKDCTLMIESCLKRINELEEENVKLKRLNEQLTKNIMVLREGQ